MTDPGANAEAYQILVDLQVTIRRIIQRGLEKVSGKTWYLDGCPPGLFERLVERKEREIAIDRFSREYQELITFASLDDLAAIIEFNADLAKLLAAIAPAGEPMIDRLREIEGLRLKLAASVPFDDEDFETLTRYHREFRESLQRRKRPSGEETPPPPAAPVPEPGAPETGSGPAPVVATPVGPAPETNRGAEFSTQAATFDELVDVVGGMKFGRPVQSEPEDPVPDIDAFKTAAAAQPPAQDEQPDAPTALDVERAMAADDDREVLRVVHREVMALADSVFRSRFDRESPVWETLRSSGWFDLKKADLALAPLELFYDIVARAANARRSGADDERVKDLLNQAGFSKLLLSLREMFIRQQQ